MENGSGIPDEDYDSVSLSLRLPITALTSILRNSPQASHFKLETFEDLTIVCTFGFRGEALSSLFALCEQLTVVTAAKETAPMGVSPETAPNGHVKNRSTNDKPVGQCTGFTYYTTGFFLPQKGTTVTITSLSPHSPFAGRSLREISSVNSEKPPRCYTRLLWVRVAPDQACV